MRGYTHITFAAAMTPLLPNSHPASILGVLVGSLAPDIDIQGSPASKVLYIDVEHRSFFHSITAALIISLPLFFISKDFALGFFAGYLSHLFLDMFNPSGVPLFFPGQKRQRIMKIRVGSIGEYIILGIFLFINLFVVLPMVISYVLRS